MANFLRKSIDALKAPIRRSSFSNLHTEDENGVVLPKSEYVDMLFRLTKETTSVTLWNNKMYVASTEEILNIDEVGKLRPFASELVGSIIKATDFGRIIRGVNSMATWKSFLVTAHETGEIAMWNSNEEIVLRFEAFNIAATHLYVWDELIITKSADNRTKVWKIIDNEAKCVQSIDTSLQQCGILQKYFVTLSSSDEFKSLKLWDKSFNPVKSLGIEGNSIRTFCVWNNTLACVCDQTVRVIDENGEEQCKFNIGGEVLSLCGWGNKLVCCTVSFSGILSTPISFISIWTGESTCEYKIRIDRGAQDLVVWNHRLIARGISSTYLFIDKRMLEDDKE